MYAIINIGGKEVPMEANAGTCIRYRMLFKKNLDDLWTGINPNKSEACAELSYIMAMSAEKADMNKLTFDSFMEWISDFSGTAFLDAFEQIYDLYTGNAQTEVEAKKKDGEQSEK